MPDILHRRINYLRERIRMRDVMDHFGHRYRLYGNMLCPFHEEQHPSARLYDNQDTMWCWVCSPSHGIDIVEYVILALGLEADVDKHNRLTAHQRHALATYKALEYLEEAFGISYASEPWERKMEEALPPTKTQDYDPESYWRNQHRNMLRLLSLVDSDAKWFIYTDRITVLLQMRNSPLDDQSAEWDKLREELLVA